MTGPDTKATLAAPRAVFEIAQRLNQNGFEAWAVGGAVRDALSGLAGGDWDLATDATPAEMRRVFRRTVPIGIEHGTVGVPGADRILYEVTTFRRDVETDGRHATVAFAKTLEEDLARRDFTINAVAWNPLTGETRDPFNGRHDLSARILRTVGDADRRFAEDYLRVLRALRFAGHFSLTIEQATWTALVAATPRLGRLSAERVREELAKVLARTRNASVTLSLYAESGVLEVLLPELASTRGVEVDGMDAWRVAIRTVDAVPPTRLQLRWSALLHTTGYPDAATKDLRGGVRYTGHEQLGARRAAELLKRLKSSNADTDRVAAIVAHQSDLFPPDSPDSGIRRWLAHVTPALVHDLFRLRIARQRAQPMDLGHRDIVERWRKAHAVLHARPVLTLDRLAIDGNDLLAAGLEPGPGFGRILGDLLSRVIEDPSLNERETLLALVSSGQATG